MLKKKIVSLKKPLVIFIYGVPGTRKSSTAIQLASRLGIKVVIGTDQIRDALKPYIDDPFLMGSTHNRWKIIGQRTPENIIKGYLTQSEIVRTAVLEVLKLAKNRGENIIMEGVHLFPDLYSELQNNQKIIFFHFLLSAENESAHQKNINLKVSLRHGKEKGWPKEKIEDIREIQKFFLSSWPPHVRLVDSNTVQGKVDKIMKVLEESL